MTNKNMIINFLNSITLASTIKTKTEEDGTVIQNMESRIKLPKPEKPAPAPILTEPIGFTLITEKNANIKIAAIKPHLDPHCACITYKEFSDEGELLTGQYDKNGHVISEYSTIVFNWFETMLAFSPVSTAATNISYGNTAEMYVPRMLNAVMKAMKKNQDKFRLSINIYNKTMDTFNTQIKNISIGITNVQSKLLQELDEQKAKTEELTTMIRQVADALEERNEHPGIVADIRGTLGVPIEERYPHINAGTPAVRSHRRSRKEAADAANADKK